MMNILSYVGMSIQSEVCLWTLVGLVRTIFDATLFKVNANLKQIGVAGCAGVCTKTVWQMNMPLELSMSVQRALRTMISGVMLVQCFTVYVYLATYIMLLYPVFLEERPTLVLPWLLLSAVRNLLCELTCLALGLGTCVLLGPARTPCIKFVIVKFISITPAFYMWMLVYSYYHGLKVAAAFNTFSAVAPIKTYDYGLELAVRRRRTKSLFGEDALRNKIVANCYEERSLCTNTHPRYEISPTDPTETSNEDIQPETDSLQPLPVTSILSRKFSELRTYEDWCGNEIMMPRDADRILEQIVLMLLRISVYITKEGKESINAQILNSPAPVSRPRRDCTAMPADDTETPPFVGSNLERVRKASYINKYPQIFQKNKPQSSEVLERKMVYKKSGPDTSLTIGNNELIDYTDNNSGNISSQVEKLTHKQKNTIKNKIKANENTPERKESVVELKNEDISYMYDEESVEHVCQKSMNEREAQYILKSKLQSKDSLLSDSNTFNENEIQNATSSRQGDKDLEPAKQKIINDEHVTRKPRIIDAINIHEESDININANDTTSFNHGTQDTKCTIKKGRQSVERMKIISEASQNKDRQNTNSTSSEESMSQNTNNDEPKN